MSSIAASATSAGTDLYSFFRRIASNASPAASATGATGPASSSTATQAPPKAHHHHGGGHGGGGELFKQIQSAVSDALQSSQSSGSSDPNKVIESAIAKVLSGQSSASSSSTPAASASATSPASGTAPGTTDADGDGDKSAAAGSSAAGSSSARQAFAQLLQSFGVSQDQFRADFAAALKDAQGGAANPNAAFKSFPPGTALDTTA